MGIVKILKDKVTNGEISSVLSELEAIFEKFALNHNDIILLEARYNINHRNMILGLVESSIYKNELNQIINSSLFYIDELKEIDAPYAFKNSEDKNKILGICKSEDDAKELNRFFAGLNLVNAKAKVLNDLDLEIDSYKLVVFDAHSISEPEQPMSNEMAYMNLFTKLLNKKHFTVFYGNKYEKIEKHRDIVQAANSKFSLYARINEMLEYINTFHP